MLTSSSSSETCTSLKEALEHEPRQPWCYGVFRDTDEGEGLREKTGIITTVTLTDQWRMNKDLTHYEALQQAASMIPGAGVHASARHEDIGEDFAQLNQEIIAKEREGYSPDYNLYRAILIYGATPEQLSEALDRLVQSSDPSLPLGPIALSSEP